MGEENDRRERVYLVAATFSTEGWTIGAQYPYPNLKIKALLNKHSKTQKRNYSGETSVRCLGHGGRLGNSSVPFRREGPMSGVFSHVHPQSGLASSADASGLVPGMHLN